MSGFQALDLSIDLIRSLRGPLDRVRSRDPLLSQQLRRAAASVALNLGEGRRRSGRDRQHHWRIAAGSAEEARTALRVAEAQGDMEPRDAALSLELLDRVLAMLWKMTH